MHVGIDLQVVLYALGISLLVWIVLRILESQGSLYMYIGAWIFLTIAMGLTYDIYDYEIYKGMYEGSVFFRIDYISDVEYAGYYGLSHDYGFTIINLLGQEMGLTYGQFKFLMYGALSAVFILILYYALHSAVKVALVLGLYTFFPFYDDIIQHRNFIVELLFTIAFLVYVKSKSWPRLKYIAIMLLAVTFHSISWAYLLFVLLDKIKAQKYMHLGYKGLVWLGLLLPVYVGALSASISDVAIYLISNITYLPTAFAGHYMGYITDSMHWGWLIPYVFSLIIVYSSHVLLSIVDKKGIDRSLFVYKYLYNLKELSRYICLFLPLQVFTSNMTRIPRDTLLLFYIGFALALPYLGRQKRYLGYILAVLAAFVIGVSDFYTTSNNSSLGFYMIIENNYLWDFLFD